MRTLLLLVFGVPLLFAMPLPTLAQAVGSQFEINTYTTSMQQFVSLDVDSNGDFVAVWSSNGSYGSDTLGFSIQAQRYASDGTPRGSQLQVNSLTLNTQTHPSVGMDADGDFVVVWESYYSPHTIQGQRYASDGTRRGVELQVNTYSAGTSRWPEVGVDADGDFVVVWQSEGSVGNDSLSESVQGQRYASDGSEQGSQFQVNTYTQGGQRYASVGLSPGGGFVVAWTSYGSSGSDSLGDSVQGQRYASDGSRIGGEFQVNTYTSGPVISPDQSRPSVAVDADGDFVVVWQSLDYSGSDNNGTFSIQGQRYASDGTARGGEFQINTSTLGAQRNASVDMDADGGFVAVWESFESGGSDVDNLSVQGQRYAPDGRALGGEFQVNTYTTNAQLRPSVGSVADGFVVAWESYASIADTDGSSSIQGQRYPIRIFSDGFESGATSAWSAEVIGSP